MLDNDKIGRAESPSSIVGCLLVVTTFFLFIVQGCSWLQEQPRVLEPEKLYDLHNAENDATKHKTNVKALLIISNSLVVLLAFIHYIYSKREKIAELEKDKLHAEKQKAESAALLIEQKIKEQKNIIAIYHSFLSQYSCQQQQLENFEMKIRGSRDDRSLLADEYKLILKETQKQFNHLSHELFLTPLFKDMVQLPLERNFINKNDYLLLIMLTLQLDNNQIAAFLNTNLKRLKSRKQYLKKKLNEKVPPSDILDNLLSLF